MVWTSLFFSMGTALLAITVLGPSLATPSMGLVIIGFAIGICVGVTGQYDINDTYNFSIEMPIAMALILSGHPLAAIACAAGSPIGQQLRRNIVPHLFVFNIMQLVFASLSANWIFTIANGDAAVGEVRWVAAGAIAAVVIVYGNIPVVILDRLTGLISFRDGLGVIFEELQFMIPVGLITSLLCAGLVNTPVGFLALFFPIIFQRAMYGNIDRALRAVNESLKDPLTSLGNRRMFDANVDGFFTRDTPELVFGLFIDLDHFKQLNDTLGHDAGDEALIKTAAVIQRNMRSSDLACRVGGEEFIVMFNAASQEFAFDVGERLRLEIERQLEEYGVTASIGVAQVRDNESPAELVRRGDEAMYRAKRSGRNRVIVDWDETDGRHLAAVA